MLFVFFSSYGYEAVEDVLPSSQDHRGIPGDQRSASASLGSTYYVAFDGFDTNPGTEAQPWRTIQRAADTLVAGDTVYIKAGNYEEQVIPQNSGSPGNYIVYSAYPGHTVTIDGADVPLPGWESGLFDLTDKSYIKISGIKIQNAGPNDNNAGIYVDGSDHIIIEKNHTYNTVSSGIGVWGSRNIIIDGNEVELGCNDGEQESITVAGTDTFEIKNNHVHHGGPGTNGGEGIDAKDGASNGKIFGNHVNHMNNDRTCLYMDAWDKPTFNIDVYQNVLHDCGAGISLASENGGRLHNIRVYNNIVYHNRSNSLEIGNWGVPGVPVRPVESVTFINNTVYGNGFAGWGGGMHNENSDAINIVVRNNIFSQNLSFQIANEAGYSGANFTIAFNLIDGYRGFTGETRGSDAVEGDPRFLNPSAADFHLQGTSPAIDRGSDVDAPGIDFAGIPRPQDGNDDGTPAYDIGAYEALLFSEHAYLPSVHQMTRRQVDRIEHLAFLLLEMLGDRP
jgi:parallel beta-helix repeat protein